jgi:hypothetical protein
MSIPSINEQPPLNHHSLQEAAPASPASNKCLKALGGISISATLIGAITAIAAVIIFAAAPLLLPLITFKAIVIGGSALLLMGAIMSLAFVWLMSKKGQKAQVKPFPVEQQRMEQKLARALLQKQQLVTGMQSLQEQLRVKSQQLLGLQNKSGSEIEIESLQSQLGAKDEALKDLKVELQNREDCLNTALKQRTSLEKECNEQAGLNEMLQGEMVKLKREINDYKNQLPENTFSKTFHKSPESNKGNMENVIQFEKILRDKSYSSEEVIKLAETTFEDHEYRIEILDGIESRLTLRNYQECVNEEIMPSVYGEEDVYINYPNLKAESNSKIRKGILIHQTILAFFDSLPEVDVTPYRAVAIKEGLPLTSQEVMQRADEAFKAHNDKEKILKNIAQKLKSCDYERSLRRGTPPYLNSDGYTSSYYGFRMPDEIEIDKAVSQFLRSLPGVDVAPYVGHRLK